MVAIIELSAKGIIKTLTAAAVVLAILGLAAALLDHLSPSSGFWLREAQESFVRLFSLDREGNIPTWYQSGLLLLCCALSAAIGRLSGADVRGRWLLMAALFLCLSIDEAAIIHEMLIQPMRLVFHTSGYFFYGWVIPAAGLVVVVALYYLRFVLALPGPVRFRMILGAGVYVLGALVVESISGRIEEQNGRVLAYDLAAVVEETLEMVGMVAFISGLLLYLHSEVEPFEIRVTHHDRAR
jgi:hypothetical protein